jgi:hypothetical protein
VTYRRVLDWIIDHLYTPLGTTSNYSATANLHISQITAESAKILKVYIASVFKIGADKVNCSVYSEFEDSYIVAHSFPLTP